MCSVEASHVPLGMHIEKVMLVEQALETEEQAAKRRKSNKECVVETCMYMHGTICIYIYDQYRMYMVNTATICMYMYGQYCYNNMCMHGQYCYNMYVQAWSILQYNMYLYAWYISKITKECPTDSLLTTHAHYISDGFVGACKGRTTWGTVILHNFV